MNDQPIEVSDEQKELLGKYFNAQKGEKPLNQEEYNKIRNLLDRQRGGVRKEIYPSIKDNPDLVRGALVSQARRDHRIMDAKAAESREVILKVLTAKPGEKNVSKEEFRNVAIYLDRQNGGLRRHAYQLFKDDKAMMDAGKAHREAWKAQKTDRFQGMEPSPDVRDTIDKFKETMKKKAQEVKTSVGIEPEPGD